MFFSHVIYFIYSYLFRWLYRLILAKDANFKQKARLRSDVARDPPLGPGWGTFVENCAYIEYVLPHAANADEVRH